MMRPLLRCVAVLLAWGVAGASTAGTPNGVDPRADDILRQMGAYLKAAGEYTFRVRVTYDRVRASGQKIEFARNARVSVRRPDGLQAEVRGDVLNERVWYDGRRFSFHNLDRNVYSTTEVPPVMDAAFDLLALRYGITTPVADFVYSDPYAILVEHVTSGQYVGRHEVDGVPTHHLAFSQDNIDWQIWVEDGHRPVPRKLVITYKRAPSAPQFRARLLDWNFAPRLADSLFRFTPPAGAQEVHLSELSAEER